MEAASMDKSFWYDKWTNNELGFHEPEVNPLFSDYFSTLNIKKNSRVFLPLCGKTLDIGWLLSNGYHVAGIELYEPAIKQLFTEIGLESKITNLNQLKHYSAKNIDIFVGDIFELSRDTLGRVDAVFDRGALVALPEAIRPQYSNHVINITNTAPQLLISYQYNQGMKNGPPFSISDKEINTYYGSNYEISTLTNQDVTGELANGISMQEQVRHLKFKT